MAADIKEVEKILKGDDTEQITELFIERRFDALEDHELMGLFTNPEIDLIQCLINANQNIDWAEYPYGLNYPEEFYNLIIDKLPGILLKRIETLEKDEVKILVWLELNYHLTAQQISLLSSDAIKKYIKAYFEARWDYFDGDYDHLTKFQNKFGKTLSNYFKELCEEIILINDKVDVGSIHYNEWLELLKKKDLRELLENDNLHFLDRLVTSIEYDYDGFSEDFNKLIFNHVLSIIPPVEIRALIELQELLKEQFIYVVDLYYDEDFPGMKIENNHVAGLKLSGCELKSLPDSIGYLDYLRDLDLDSNELTALPETIGRLQSLKSLNIVFNKLTRLPNSIGKLKSLERFYIGDNNIMEFPETIWNLKIAAGINNDFFDSVGIEATALTKVNKFKFFESQKTGAQLASFNDAFKSYLTKYGLRELGDELINLLKHAIRIDIKHIKVHDSYMKVGVSKFGGDPDVPKNFEWPKCDGKHLEFLMQINLVDIKHFEYNLIPFGEGMLSVFYSSNQRKSNGINPRILYFNEKELHRAYHSSISPEVPDRSCATAFFKDFSLPTPWAKEVDDLVTNWNQRDNYEKLYKELFELNFSRTSHWMFGYPFELAGPGMELKVELASNDIDSTELYRVEESVVKQLREDNWVLLLMLSSDHRPRWNWLEGGRLYFWIDKDDLKAGKFEKVQVIAENQKGPMEEGSYPRCDFKSVKQLKKEYSETPLDGIALTTFQIRTFLNALAGDNGCQYSGAKWRCGGKDFEYARNILDLMEISKAEQEKLLEKCRDNGGYCDCEILMNAAGTLLGEDTPW